MGQSSPASLSGVTLMHEHVFCDLSARFREPAGITSSEPSLISLSKLAIGGGVTADPVGSTLDKFDGRQHRGGCS